VAEVTPARWAPGSKVPIRQVALALGIAPGSVMRIKKVLPREAN
jgi:hypothetical protein